MNTELEEAHRVINYLWDLLDDIDTLDDSCRGDDAAFRRRTREAQKRRWFTGITSDGYTLDLSKMKHPPAVEPPDGVIGTNYDPWVV